MSSTVSMGAYSPSHWSYMADVMAHGLRAAAKTGVVDCDAIPPAVYEDSQYFLELALGATRKDAPPAKSANVNAFVIASDAIRGAGIKLELPQEKMNELLTVYSDFINRMSKLKKLSKKDKDTAGKLSDFFYNLSQTGDEEDYHSIVRYEPNFPGFR